MEERTTFAAKVSLSNEWTETGVYFDRARLRRIWLDSDICGYTEAEYSAEHVCRISWNMHCVGAMVDCIDVEVILQDKIRLTSSELQR